MEQAFNKALNRIYGTREKAKTVLAVSGGVDSIVMAHLYYNSDVPYMIAHCNFQLRGEESQRDEEFVISLGQELGAEVVTKKFDTEAYAKLQKCSIQMAARELRYDWFKELMKINDAKIATAHQANDVAETLVFNLVKGTGIAGLHGISENENNIVRPLLWAQKEEILAYAKEKNIKWREDQSNESEKYMRNIIRKRVIPEFEKINPAFVTSSLRTASRIREVEAFFNYSVAAQNLLEHRDKSIYINKKRVWELPGKVAVLKSLIADYGFNYDQVLRIIDSWESTGASFLSDHWRLNIDREHLIISEKERTKVDLHIGKKVDRVDAGSVSLITDVLGKADFTLVGDNKIASLDIDKLKFPLQLRNWQHGDVFTPLGMKGRKKVSDFLIDAKISMTEKEGQLVLLSDNKIIWLVGLRIDDGFKVTDSTINIYQIQLEEGES